MRLAAVIGREFDRAILEQLYVHKISLNRALEELIRQDLVQPLRLLPRQEFIFKNALTQVVVYETLLRQQRREIHKQVAASMEILFANRIEEHVEALAFHYGNSNDAEKAVDFAERAAAKAEQVFSLNQARRWYRNALDIIGLVSQSDGVRSRRISLTLRWAGVSHFAPVAEHVSALETALADAEALGEDSSIAHTLYWLGRMHYNLGHMEESLAFFNQCSDMATSLKDEELSAQIHNTSGRICWTSGQYEQGIQHFESGIGVLEKLGKEQALASPLGMLGQLHGALGNFPTGGALIERALNISRRGGDLPTESVCLLRLAILNYFKGNWAEVISSGERNIEIAKTTGNRHISGVSSALTAYAAYMSGQRSRGFAWIRDAIGIIERHGSNIAPQWYGMAAWISLSEGDLGLAQIYTEKGVTQVREGIPHGESIVMSALAEMSSRASPPNWTEAQNRFEKSLQICRESGTRPDLAFIQFRQAEILHKKGELESALEQLTEAENLFSDMEMTGWSEQAEGLRQRIEGGQPFIWLAPYVDGPPIAK